MQVLQNASRGKVLRKKNLLVKMAEQVSQPDSAISQPAGNNRDTRKQIVCTDDLRQHIADILAVDLELDKEEQQFFQGACASSHSWTARRHAEAS